MSSQVPATIKRNNTVKKLPSINKRPMTTIPAAMAPLYTELSDFEIHIQIILIKFRLKFIGHILYLEKVTKMI